MNTTTRPRPAIEILPPGCVSPVNINARCVSDSRAHERQRLPTYVWRPGHRPLPRWARLAIRTARRWLAVTLRAAWVFAQVLTVAAFLSGGIAGVFLIMVTMGAL